MIFSDRFKDVIPLDSKCLSPFISNWICSPMARHQETEPKTPEEQHELTTNKPKTTFNNDMLGPFIWYKKYSYCVYLKINGNESQNVLYICCHESSKAVNLPNFLLFCELSDLFQCKSFNRFRRTCASHGTSS